MMKRFTLFFCAALLAASQSLAVAISSLDELKGIYTWETEQASTVNSRSGDRTDVHGVYISVDEEKANTILIHNLKLRNYTLLPIEGTVDLTTGVITIPAQVGVYFSSAQWLDFKGKVEGEDADIKATVESDGSITFGEQWIALFLINNEKEVMAFSSYVMPGSKFTRDTRYNGLLETKVAQINTAYTDHLEPVIVTQSGNVVTVEGFMGYEANVDITLNADKTFTIESQLIEEGTQDSKYYTYAADYSNYDPDGDIRETFTPTIQGTGTDTVLSWGNFVLFSPSSGNGGWWKEPMASGKLTLIDGSTFNFPGGTGTGISLIHSDNDASAPAYNLAGQQVSGSYKGLVIKNGRKYLVK